MNTQNSTHSRQTVRETLLPGHSTSNQSSHEDNEWMAEQYGTMVCELIERQSSSRGSTRSLFHSSAIKQARRAASYAFLAYPELRVPFDTERHLRLIEQDRAREEAKGCALTNSLYYSALVLKYADGLAFSASHFRFWAQKSATYAFEAYPELREPCTQSEINNRIDREGRQRTARAEFDVLYPPRVQTGLTRVSGIPGFALLQAFLGRWNDMNPVPTADEAYVASLSEPVNDFSNHPLDSTAASQLARISGRKSAEWI